MKADFHIHTNFSYNGLPSPKEVVDFAISKDLGCIAICDHGTIEGALEAENYAKSKPILVIVGIEIKSREGEILGLNVKEKIENGLSAKETIEKIITQGGMAVIPHPFDYFSWFSEIEDFVDFFQEKKVAIEIFNASLLFNFCNFEAKQFAKKFNLPFTAGSDAHSLDFIGKAYLEIPGENLLFEEAIASSLAEPCDSKARWKKRTKFSSLASAKTSAIKEILEEIKIKKAKVGSEKIPFQEKLGDHLKRVVARFKKLELNH